MFFRGVVLVEGGCVVVGGVHGWFLLFFVCWLLCLRVVGGVRVAWVLLVVVEVAAAGFVVAGAWAVAVGALAVPVCGVAVACCLVHGSCCGIAPSRVSTYVDARVGWVVGWLVGCFPRGLVFVCERAGRVFVGDRVGWWRAWCFVGAGWGWCALGGCVGGVS